MSKSLITGYILHTLVTIFLLSAFTIGSSRPQKETHLRVPEKENPQFSYEVDFVGSKPPRVPVGLIVYICGGYGTLMVYGVKKTKSRHSRYN
jgi:hypothetical protein